MNILLSIVSVAALASLVTQYGFYLSNKLVAIISRIDLLIINFYLFQYLVKLAFCRNKLAFFKRHWFESLLAFLILVEIAIIMRAFGFITFRDYFFNLDINALTEAYIGIAQILLIFTIIAESVRINPKIARLKVHPSQTLMLSFLFVIILGTLLLMLPKSTHPDYKITFIDALFTAASATCVTGLSIADTGTFFSFTGQVIILVLIQIGGIGIMTLSSFLALMFRQGVGMRERVLLYQMLNVEKLGLITNMLHNIVLLTFTFEAIGMITLLILWSNEGWSFQTLLFNSLFHSVSAFCNAGFSTFSDSLTRYSTNIPVLMTIMFLITVGGLGFAVVMDLQKVFTNLFTKKKNASLRVQTKIVLIVSSILLVSGGVVLYLLDNSNGNQSTRIITALFNSVTSRTAGFNTVPIELLTIPSTIFLLMLMFVGASPGSTGGGIKTTTLGILWSSILAIISGKNRILMFKRRISFVVLNRALVVFVFSILVVFSSTFILSITETASLIDIIFESVSAYGTVGLSRGLTAKLSDIGKYVIIVSMFIGRIGTLTLAFAITAPTETTTRIEYPTEPVTIG